MLGVFVVESALFTALVGGSFGQVATRLRVVSVDGSGGNVDLLHALGRQLLIALVIPPLVFRPDGRGLHDMMAGSAVVTVQTWRGPGRDARLVLSPLGMLASVPDRRMQSYRWPENHAGDGWRSTRSSRAQLASAVATAATLIDDTADRLAEQRSSDEPA